MASPIVAGAAALVLDKISGGSLVMSTNLRDDVIAAIRSNADHTGALGQNMLAWTQYGRLNLYAALTGSCTDADGDGFCLEGNDCDDTDASINPGAEEVCDDTIDNDCDGKTDCPDSDCLNDLACSTSGCLSKGELCESNDQCCSGKCAGIKCR
jgi:hypothetical protein